MVCVRCNNYFTNASVVCIAWIYSHNAYILGWFSSTSTSLCLPIDCNHSWELWNVNNYDILLQSSADLASRRIFILPYLGLLCWDFDTFKILILMSLACKPMLVIQGLQEFLGSELMWINHLLLMMLTILCWEVVSLEVSYALKSCVVFCSLPQWNCIIARAAYAIFNQLNVPISWLWLCWVLMAGSASSWHGGKCHPVNNILLETGFRQLMAGF